MKITSNTIKVTILVITFIALAVALVMYGDTNALS